MIYILAIIYWLIFEVIIVKGALAFRDAEKVERGEAPDSGYTFIPDILVFVPLFCATAWLIKWLAPGDAIVILTALAAVLCARRASILRCASAIKICQPRLVKRPACVYRHRDFPNFGLVCGPFDGRPGALTTDWSLTWQFLNAKPPPPSAACAVRPMR